MLSLSALQPTFLVVFCKKARLYERVCSDLFIPYGLSLNALKRNCHLFVDSDDCQDCTYKDITQQKQLRAVQIALVLIPESKNDSNGGDVIVAQKHVQACNGDWRAAGTLNEVNVQYHAQIRDQPAKQQPRRRKPTVGCIPQQSGIEHLG